MLWYFCCFRNKKESFEFKKRIGICFEFYKIPSSQEFPYSPLTSLSMPQLDASFIQAIAGLTAGATSTLLLHPFDLIKTR